MGLRPGVCHEAFSVERPCGRRPVARVEGGVAATDQLGVFVGSTGIYPLLPAIGVAATIYPSRFPVIGGKRESPRTAALVFEAPQVR